MLCCVVAVKSLPIRHRIPLKLVQGGSLADYSVAYKENQSNRVSQRQSFFAFISLSVNRIIGYYRMYEWRTKAHIILCAYAGLSESVHFVHVQRHCLLYAAQFMMSPSRNPPYVTIIDSDHPVQLRILIRVQAAHI